MNHEDEAAIARAVELGLRRFLLEIFNLREPHLRELALKILNEFEKSKSDKPK